MKDADGDAATDMLDRQMVKRDRKNQRKRRHLAEMAVRLFEEKGLAMTNVEEIADAADYSTSTFYRLFPDKEEVVFYDFSELLDILKAAFALPNHGNAWNTIRNVFIEEIAHRWDADEGELGIRRLRLIYAEPILYSRFLSKNSDWEVEMAKLVTAELKGAGKDLLGQVIAGAASAAFRAGWRIKLTSDNLALTDCVKNAFDQLEKIGHFFRTPDVGKPPSKTVAA